MPMVLRGKDRPSPVLHLKKLLGSDPPEFRLRVGDHRVRFTEDDADTLHIHAVKDRKDAYR